MTNYVEKNPIIQDAMIFIFREINSIYNCKNLVNCASDWEHTPRSNAPDLFNYFPP